MPDAESTCATIGLKKVLKEGEDVPELFNDPLFKRSSYWVLSTSAVFSKHFGPYGWGEVRMIFSISAQHKY